MYFLLNCFYVLLLMLGFIIVKELLKFIFKFCNKENVSLTFAIIGGLIFISLCVIHPALALIVCVPAMYILSLLRDFFTKGDKAKEEEKK